MKIHILLCAAALALSLLSVEGFPRRGGRGHNGHHGRHHGAGRRRNYAQVCNQPPQTGMCYARMPMWFYNSTSEACETFTYGGCGGNANRFWSERACNRRCSEPCSKPLDEGEECEDTTTSPTTLYYYDAEEDACKQFEYTGCGGNDNKFRSLNHCERRCLDDSSDSDDDAEPEGAVEEIDREFDEDVEDLFSDSDDEEDFTDEDDESSETRIRRARRRRPRCHTARCRLRCPFGQEVLTDENGCVTCRCKQPPSLPEHCRDRPMCRMACPNGFQTGDDGCPICRCNPPPTSPSLPDGCRGRPMCRMACPNGFVTGKDGCPICRCKPMRPVRPTIPEHCIGRPMCMMHCATGFQTGEDGCPICRCNPPTLEALSPYDEELAAAGGIEVAAAAGTDLVTESEDDEEEEEVTIVRHRRCHIPRCRMRCPFGYQKDEFGCAKCVCNPAPAEPVPEHCQDKPSCYRRCPNGFEVDEEGCPTCRCRPRDPVDLPRPGGGNGSPSPSGCRLLYCFIPCLYGSRPDARGCPTCDCLPAPTTHEEIEDEDVTVEEAEPRPAGTQCVQLKCFAPCRHGYERDRNGCQTCRCRSAPGGPTRHRRSHPESGASGVDLSEEWRRGGQGPRHCKPVLCPMDLRCPYGFKRDAQGCQSSCECRKVVRPLPDRSDVCSLPQVVGPCFGAIPRFYFNSDKGECESFRFGGCRGNGNNFRSIEDCRRRCEV